ncbi:unnamed protein product [Symbiodinium sp. CCMP2592]|nr:unnamed protein product [Symbiodinium sp. CCMP2592]
MDFFDLLQVAMKTTNSKPREILRHRLELHTSGSKEIMCLQLWRVKAETAMLYHFQVWEHEGPPRYMESGRVLHSNAVDEGLDGFSFLPNPQTAEWLQTVYANDTEEMKREKRMRQDLEVPKGRPLDFQLELTKSFCWKHPLKAGRRPVRSTVLQVDHFMSEFLDS